MEKKKSFFDRRPYVCYVLYAGLLFAFNLFLRWWSGELDADEYLRDVSHQYPYIDSRLCVGRPVSSQESCKQKEDR